MTSLSLRHKEHINSFTDYAATVMPGTKAIADEEAAAVGHCVIARPQIASQDGTEFVAVESKKFHDRINTNGSILRRSIMKKSFSHSTTLTMMMDDYSRHSMDHPRNSMKQNVCFSNLEIRSYNITLGTAPTRNGPPISLDWDYDPAETATYEVDAYEHYRHPRRTKIELLMPPSHREDLLRDAGFSRNQIKLAKEEAQLALKQREKNAQSFNNTRLILDEVWGKANDTRVKVFSKLGRLRSAH